MNDDQVVVFADERAELAYMLRDRLLEAGIEAVVVNDATQIAVGLIPPGWTAAPRVVVAKQDADAAQAIVQEFDSEQATPVAPSTAHLISRTNDRPLPEESDIAAAHCPDCGMRRTAVCPVCQTASAEFPMADAAPTAKGSGVFFGQPANCQDSRGPKKTPDPLADSDELMLVCTMCDEPFVPGYLRRCEWCGHDFGEGIQLKASAPREPLDQRTVATVIALAACVLAVLAYFASLVAR